MLMKKGKQWALSCVAISAVVLVGMGTTNVYADDTATQNGGADAQPEATQNANTQGTSSQGANVQGVGTQGTNAQTAGAQVQSASQASQQPVTEAENSEVQDGGKIEDDLPDNTQSNELGYPSYFHIFANEATLNAHTNGNLAVGNLHGNVNFGTNTKEGLLNKDISYIQNVNNIANSSFVSSGDTRENKVIFGTEPDVDVSNPNRPAVNGTNIDHLVKEEVYEDKGNNKYVDIAGELKRLESKSSDLSKDTPNISASNSDFPDPNQRVINLENYQPNEKNQIVIDLDGDVLQAGTPLTIFGLSKDAGGTNVIINVNTNGQDPYVINSQIKLIYNDGSSKVPEERPNQETEYFDDNHLLWNFHNNHEPHNGEIDVERPFQGSILAPKATVKADANIDGNIIADKVIVNAETHRWDLQDNSGKETTFEKPITLPGELPGGEDNNGGNIEEPGEEEEDIIDPDTGDIEAKPTPEEPGTDKPGTEEPDTDKPGTETPGTEEPDTDKPGTETPGTEEPDTDKPGTETPGTEEPDTDKPGTETPGTEEPDTDKPGTETPGTEEPDTDKPGTETPGTEEPDTDDGDQGLIVGGGSEADKETSNNEENNDDSDLDNELLTGVVDNNKDESQTPNNAESQTDEAGTLPQTGETSGILATIAGLLLIVIGFLLKEINFKKR